MINLAIADIVRITCLNRRSKTGLDYPDDWQRRVVDRAVKAVKSAPLKDAVDVSVQAILDDLMTHEHFSVGTDGGAPGGLASLIRDAP